MNKNLAVIQKISQVARVVCRVLFVVSIVAAIVSLVSAILVGVLGTGLLVKLGDVTIYGVSVDEATTKTQVIMMLISSAIMMIPAIILMKFAENYFALELNEGTPFTVKGADAIKKLGIMTIVIPIVAEFVSQLIISLSINTANINITNGGMITTGLTFLFLHYVFKYGAEATGAAAPSKPPVDPAAPAPLTDDRSGGDNA